MDPDLSPPERAVAQVEGWILGVENGLKGRPAVKDRSANMSPSDLPSSIPANEVTSLLVPIARAGKTITYGELAKRLRTVQYISRAPAFHKLLCDVSEAQEKMGNGLLSAVVVSARTGRPGVGFFSFAKSMGRKIENQEQFWRDEMRKLKEAYSNRQLTSK